MFKYRLIRAILEVVTLRLSVFEPGMAPFPAPKKFPFFSRFPKDPIVQDGLARAYQRVFSEPPWNEQWPRDMVVTKLNRELKDGKPFLVTMQGNERWPIGGFAWGALLPVNALELRIGEALGTRPIGLEGILRARGVDRVVYFDEFAILRQFRRGLNPIRFLLQPGLELGYQHGVHRTLFWSTPTSRVVPLSLYMGYQPVFSTEAEGKEIVFLYNENFLPLLKMAQNFDWRRAAKIMRVTSRILGRKRART